MIASDQEAIAELQEVGELVLAYKRFIKRKRPQRGKSKLESKKRYKKNRKKIQRQQKKYRKKFKRQLMRTRKRKGHGVDVVEILRVAKALVSKKLLLKTDVEKWIYRRGPQVSFDGKHAYRTTHA